MQHKALQLKRSLGTIETWGFGVNGLLLWLGTAPSMHAALGPQAIFVWLPGVVVGTLLNLQVKRLGMHWPTIAGGTPSYAAQLLKNYPFLARYVAIGYFLGWVSVPSLNAIILTQLIEVNLQPLGITCPEMLLKIGFTAIAFVVAFNGTRTLGILHLFFIVPALAFLIVFCFQGLGWLAISPSSPGFFPASWSSFSFREWAKWFFIAVYAVYGCESAASFVADSKRPNDTLQCLSFAASLIPAVYLGGSWVLMRLATPGADNTFLTLLTAAKPFWSYSASFCVTLLIAFCCLLSCATAVAVSPRVLYQLALDSHLNPVLSVVSRQGVFGPSLLITVLFSFICLLWGDITRIVMITGTGYLVSMMGIHLGLWLHRHSTKVLWPWWSLCFFILEGIVLVVGGLAWSWQDLLLGLLLPIVVVAVDAATRCMTLAPFRSQWWLRRYYARTRKNRRDFVAPQVCVLVALICSAVFIAWSLSAQLNKTFVRRESDDLLVILLVTLSFVGVAIACWTTLPQIEAIDRDREQAEKLFNNAWDAILVLDSQGKIVLSNPAAEQLFQMHSQSLIGCHIQEFFSTLTGSIDQWPNRSEQILARAAPRILEASISQDSTQHDFQEYTLILRDITERKQAEALRQSEERYALAVRGANDGLWDWNLKTNEIYFSVRWKAMLGYEESEIGTSLNEWFNRIHPEDVEQVRLDLSKHLDGVTVHFEKEHRLLHKDGTYRWMLSRGLVVRDSLGCVYRVAGSQTDVTDRRKAEERLVYDALHDSLTGLSNQALFKDRLEHVLLLAKRRSDFSFAVLFIDLDRFKIVNDSLGHMIGDQLLIGISHRLKLCIRESDTFARLGGDEFAILIEDVQNNNDVIQVADRVQQELKLPFNLSGYEVFASASIGVLLGTTDYEKAEELLRDADTAMYRAKASGRGSYEIFDMKMREHAVALLHLETDLRKAIENQEFRLYYQPIVSLFGNQVKGFEALLRWHHPQRGLVSPIEFIPLAEDTGLIVQIGEWVLWEACRQMQAWQAQFPEKQPLTISVNISPKQFSQANFAQQVKEILEETGLDAQNLELEITESTVVENYEMSKTTLTQLQDLGIRLAIDDFGTGYSSLAYLHRFTVDRLKIDRCFIKDADVDSERLEIIKAILSLASGLGINVVAEGIETTAQLAQLQSLKPESNQDEQKYFGQGYLFSKPLNCDAATALIASGSLCCEQLVS